MQHGARRLLLIKNRPFKDGVKKEAGLKAETGRPTPRESDKKTRRLVRVQAPRQTEPKQEGD